jgi:hypothetical protein
MVICWPGVASAVDICPPLKLLGQPAGGPLVKSNTSRFFFFFFSYFFFQLPGKEKKKVKKRLYMEEDIYIYISIWKCSSISYVSLYKRASRLYTAQPFSSSYMRDATARLGVFYSTTQTFLLLLLLLLLSP